MKQQASRIEIKNEANVAQIKITGYISTWANDSQSFTSTVDALLASGVKKAHLYINSRGGTMSDAFEIGNQLKRFDHVTCTLGAIAASSATLLSTYCKTVTASRNTIYMIHMPEMGTVISKPEDADSAKQAYQVYLDNLIADYVKKTGQTKEQIEAWLRAETWMNAQTALDRKFVDAIAPDDDPNLPDVQDLLTNFSNAPFSIVNSLFQGRNEPQAGQPNNFMNKEQLRKLGLPEDATQEQINAAIDKLVAEGQEAKRLQTENLVKLGEKKGLPKNAVEAMIAGNPTGVEAILNAMPDAAGAETTPPEAKPENDRLRNHIQNQAGAGNGGKPEGPKTFKELEDQGPDAVMAFAKANPKAYADLFNQGKPAHMHMTEAEVKADFN